MERIDKRAEQQVWQRVRSGELPPRQPEIQTLILAAMENDGAYRRLGTLVAGSLRRRVTELARQNQEDLLALEGIRVLSGGAVHRPRPQSPKGTAAQLLKGCYHRTCRAVTEYTARMVDPEFGSLFQTLAHSAQNQALAIAQTLGELAGGR